jgi:hypothetical protein
VQQNKECANLCGQYYEEANYIPFHLKEQQNKKSANLCGQYYEEPNCIPVHLKEQ